MKTKNTKALQQFFRNVLMGLILVSLTVGCNPKDNDKSTLKSLIAGGLLSTTAKPDDTSQANGTAQVSMAIADSQLDVTSATVTISRMGIGTPIVKTLTKVDQNWQAVISEIPTGSNYIFVGQAYDASGALLYQGQAPDVTITFNQVTDIYILLQDFYSNKRGPTDNVPVIDSFVASTNLVATSGTVNFGVTAHNPNPNYALTYLWIATGGSFNNVSSTNTIWTAPTIPGSYTITVKVTNSKGYSVMRSFVVNVKSNTGSGSITVGFNTWPVVDKIIAPDCCLTSGASMNLTLVASDSDGDTLSYLWSSNCGTFDNAATKNPIFTATSTIAGNCTVKVNLNDGRGGTNSGSLTILIKAAGM